MADDYDPLIFWNYIINSVLSSDLLKDRHIDDNSARFEFESEPITISLFVKQSLFASFCIDND